MWSDSISVERRRELIASLHSVLPAPRMISRLRANFESQATPEQVAQLLRDEPGFAWLDGANTRHLLLHRPIAVISHDGAAAMIDGPHGSVQIQAAAIDILDAALEAWRGPEEALLAGFLSYDLAAEIEDLRPQPARDFQFPTLCFALYDSALIWQDGTWTLRCTDAWRESPSVSQILRRAPQLCPESGQVHFGPLTSRPGRHCFEASVAHIVQRIHEGDFFQTNLCRRLEADLDPTNAWELHRRMRAISPARYGAFLDIGDGRSVISVSPELFLRVDADRTVESRPIKGTRPRGRDEEEDRALADELLASEKDRAELAMIVDVTRNDLSRVCEPGSVKVAEHAQLETLPTVHHTVSTVRGHLRDDASLAALLRAAFPAASITGAPKIEAMRAASAEEKQLRGPAMGSIGWISMDGRMELSVAIRTAFLTGSRVYYYAGGGITADSDPAAEFEETTHKARAFLDAMGEVP